MAASWNVTREIKILLQKFVVASISQAECYMFCSGMIWYLPYLVSKVYLAHLTAKKFAMPHILFTTHTKTSSGIGMIL